MNEAAPSLHLNQPPPYAFGETISFTAVFDNPPGRSVAEVSLRGYVDGVQVYLDVHGQNQPDWLSFALTSPQWDGAPANFVAELYYYTWKGQQETGVVFLAQAIFSTP
jgi:hypothetical protein